LAGASALGAASFFAAAFLEGLAPPVRISVILTIGLVLAVAANALGVLAAALLEGDDLARAALFDHFGRDEGAVDKGSADGCAGAFADHENFVEFDDVAGFAVELFDFRTSFGGNAVLLATGFDDCEHLYSFRVRSGSRLAAGRLFASRKRIGRSIGGHCRVKPAGDPLLRFAQAKGERRRKPHAAFGSRDT
jgi:hypothetical protein